MLCCGCDGIRSTITFTSRIRWMFRKAVSLPSTAINVSRVNCSTFLPLYLSIRSRDLVGTNVRIRSTTSATLLSTYEALLSCIGVAKSWFSPIFSLSSRGCRERRPAANFHLYSSAAKERRIYTAPPVPRRTYCNSSHSARNGLFDIISFIYIKYLIQNIL